MIYKFHPDALEEYEAAARFYGGCQVGLELRFIACVESAFHKISETPEGWRFFEDACDVV